MANHYNLDGIKTEVNKEYSRTAALLQAWENVTFPTKKDGKPFAIMSKNIDGAKYKAKEYAIQAGEYEVTVHVWADMVGYVSDSVDCYQLVKYLKDETMLEKKQNYMPKQTMLEQVYSYDIEDIKNAIADKIDFLRNRLVTLKQEMSIVESCYSEFEKAYSKAIEELQKNCIAAGDFGFSNKKNDIFYMIRDTVLNNYKYM